MNWASDMESPDAFSIQHASLIAWAYDTAQCARWSLSQDQFAAALSRSTSKRFGFTTPTPAEVESYIRTLHLEDLALACACAFGRSEAWEFFVATYRPQLHSAARAVLRGTNTADSVGAQELADSLYADLYGIHATGDGHRKSLFEYFHGRSKLSTWLRTVLAQRHVDAVRARKRLESLDTTDDGVSSALNRQTVSPPADPDRAVYLSLLDAALDVALHALSARDRLLLSYYYLDQRTLREIGRMLGDHESTISRQLDRIRGQLREGVKNSLRTDQPAKDSRAARRGLSEAQIELAFDSALEDRPLNLARMLSTGDVAVDAKK